MASYVSPNDPAALASGRYSENRPAQFVGGSIDPTSGNLIPGSRDDASNGRTASIEADIPEPAAPTTRLGSVTPEAPKTDYGALALNTGLNVAAGAASKVLGDTIGKALGGGSGGSAGSNPMDLNVGGGINNTGAGGNNGSGSAPMFEFPSPGASSYGGGGGGYYSPSIDTSPSFSGGGGYFDSHYGGGGGNSYYSGPGDSGGGSGSVICTELHRQDLLDGITFAADQRFGTMVKLYYPAVYDGYLAWARHCVTLMRVSPRFTAFVKFFATPWAQYLAMLMGERETAPVFGMVLFHIGWPLCGAIGRIKARLNAKRAQLLPAKA